MESTGVACVWLLDPPVCAGRHLPREHSPGARAGPWDGDDHICRAAVSQQLGSFEQVSQPPLAACKMSV